MGQDEMREQGITPNTITHSFVSHACKHGQQWQTAISVLDEVQQMGEQWNSAFGMWSNIRQHYTTADPIMSHAAVDACTGDHQWDQALSLVSHLTAFHLE